jgi:hypothetical protein
MKLRCGVIVVGLTCSLLLAWRYFDCHEAGDKRHNRSGLMAAKMRVGDKEILNDRNARCLRFWTAR